MEDANPFRFLDLPRELRDMIYDNLRELKDYPTHSYEENGVRVSAGHELGGFYQRTELLFAASKTMLTIFELIYQTEDPLDDFSKTTLYHLAPHVRLINCQLKTEAELQVGKHVGLTVCDGSRKHYPRSLTCNFSPRCLSTITSLEFSFVAVFTFDYLPSLEEIYEGIYSQISTQQGWLERSVQHMANLKGFKVEIQVEWPVGLNVEWARILDDPGVREEIDSLTDMPDLTEVKIWKLEREIAQVVICNKKLWWQWYKDEGWHTPPTEAQPLIEDVADDGK